MLNADAILQIPEQRAHDLFPGDVAAVRAAFHRLAADWHPDRSPDPRATAVFQHLSVLRAAALRIADAAAGRTETVELVAADGRAFRMRYRSRHRTDVGTVFCGDHDLLVRFDEAAVDVAEWEARTVDDLRFADDGMRREMGRFLPRLKHSVRLKDGWALVYEKAAHEFLLADLIHRGGGRIDPVHVAWILSGLGNIACYLGWAGVAHGAIDPTTVLVSPAMHSVALYGGWGFSVPTGHRPRALPARTLAAAPRLAIAGIGTDAALDLELIRLTGREALGDPSGSRLLGSATVPSHVTLWLCMPPAADAFADYRSWDQALARSFGPRRFVAWDIDAAEIYAAAA